MSYFWCEMKLWLPKFNDSFNLSMTLAHRVRSPYLIGIIRGECKKLKRRPRWRRLTYLWLQMRLQQVLIAQRRRIIGVEKNDYVISLAVSFDQSHLLRVCLLKNEKKWWGSCKTGMRTWGKIQSIRKKYHMTFRSMICRIKLLISQFIINGS